MKDDAKCRKWGGFG